MPDYSSELAASRKAAKIKSTKTNIKKIEKDIPASIPIFSFLIGAMNDFLDLPIIGSIPLLGDIMDIFTGLILITMRIGKALAGGNFQFKKTAKSSILIITASIIELIPGMDILPSFSFSVWLNSLLDKKPNKK